MAEQLIISISGMRGIVGENLTGGIALDYGCSFGSFLKGRHAGKRGLISVCIGRDSRPSGQMLKAAVTAGLCSAGVNVVDIGLATTPTVGVMLRELKCNGGVVITASHNPIQYNGIKLLLENGMAPAGGDAEAIRNIYSEKGFDICDSVGCGKVTSSDNANAVHIDKVLSLVDRKTISARKFKVVLDSVNGAGGPITKTFLSKLGCQVVGINDEPTGLFAHTPEPTIANLGGLCETVRQEKAGIGFAQDPDADRLAIVDENGVYIGEEYTLALAAKYAFSKRSGKAATNLSTSRMIDDIAAEAGGEVIRTPVGEANVANAMIEHNCIIGGEGNGGVIDLRVGPIRDSLVGIALVLQLMTDTGKSVGTLAAEIGGYYMHKEKFRAEKDEAETILELAKQTFADARVNTADGCRFDFEDGWLHLRMSNTEPVMRMIVEARDEAAAREYIETVTAIRKRATGAAQ